MPQPWRSFARGPCASRCSSSSAPPSPAQLLEPTQGELGKQGCGVRDHRVVELGPSRVVVWRCVVFGSCAGTEVDVGARNLLCHKGEVLGAHFGILLVLVTVLAEQVLDRCPRKGVLGG